MTDFPEILPDRDPTPPEDLDFDVDAELHRLAAAAAEATRLRAEVDRLATAVAELTGCLAGLERALRDGHIVGPSPGLARLVRDLLDRHPI